ncbi:MAG: T9SS type A sorting domain-containing protein [Bacteroidota bacterium]
MCDSVISQTSSLIFLSERHVFSVFDFQGKLIEKTVLALADGKIRLNLEAQAKGMYQVVVDNGRKSYVGKVVFE